MSWHLFTDMSGPMSFLFYGYLGHLSHFNIFVNFTNIQIENVNLNIICYACHQKLNDRLKEVCPNPQSLVQGLVERYQLHSSKVTRSELMYLSFYISLLIP